MLGRKRLLEFLCLVPCATEAPKSQVSDISSVHYHVVFEELLGYLQFGICRTAAQVSCPCSVPCPGQGCLLPVQTILALSSLLPPGLGKAAALPQLPLTAPGKLQLIGRSISDMSLLPGMVEIPQSQGYQLS